MKTYVEIEPDLGSVACRHRRAFGGALKRPGCRCWPERAITFFARWWWWCRRARPVARRVLCAAPDAALRVPCGVPAAVPLARFAVPDVAPYQTSPHLWVVSWA